MAIDLIDILRATKEMSAAPDWVPLQKDDGRLQFVSPLEIDAVTIQGVQFRAIAHTYAANRAVTFQIEHHAASGVGGPFSRIEWRPLSPHGNKGLGPAEHRFKVIADCHIHPLDLNLAHNETWVRKGRLPIALPISPPLGSYEEALAFVEKEFRIKDVMRMPIPPWTDKIL